jgi:hypothetical protein
MALLKSSKFIRIEKERNSVHKEVDTTYTSFTNNSGEKYFQIDTYGSSDRQFKGKISQSIQLNKRAAQELITVLKNEFKI